MFKMADTEFSWSALTGRVVLNTLSHPLEYAKVLIQLGHEPIPPYPVRTLLGKPALALPSVFRYVSHIKNADGFTGCYRGLGAKLCAVVVSSYTYHRVIENVQDQQDGDSSDDNEEVTAEARKAKFLRDLCHMSIARAAAVVASQPFTVIAVRTMAQFVGGEKIFVGIFASIREIYHEEGILGFFSGLVPRLLGEIIALFISSTITYYVDTFLIKEQDMHSYVSITSSFVATSLTYPFQVVSNCMVVTNTRLLAGNPPNMPVFRSWTDCWKHLSRTGHLKRGSSMLWRYYTVPPVIMDKASI